MGMLFVSDGNRAPVPPMIFPASIISDVPQNNPQVVYNSREWTETGKTMQQLTLSNGYQIRKEGKG